MTITRADALVLALALVAALPAQAPESKSDATADVAAARDGVDRALAFLVKVQQKDGSFGPGVLENLMDSGFSVETYYDYQLAADALACVALLESEQTPERRTALERGLRHLCTARMPRRGSAWDNDENWAGLYGTVATVRAAQDARFPPDSELGSSIDARGRAFVALLVRNQSPEGGWAYYDDPPISRRPTWSTSFCTALVLPALRDAVALGWLQDDAVVQRAKRYVDRCALPGGAYEYQT